MNPMKALQFLASASTEIATRPQEKCASCALQRDGITKINVLALMTFFMRIRLIELYGSLDI